MTNKEDDDIFADPRKVSGDRRTTEEGREKSRRAAPNDEGAADWWTRRRAGIAKTILGRRPALDESTDAADKE